MLTEIHAAPDKDIPQELWDRATCVIVIPSVKKAAFVFGGEYGKGLMSCRHGDAWSAPVFMQVGKGSWGLQIGAQSIDLVLLVTNDRGMQKLPKNTPSVLQSMPKPMQKLQKAWPSPPARRVAKATSMVRIASA